MEPEFASWQKEQAAFLHDLNHLSIRLEKLIQEENGKKVCIFGFRNI
jgi:hypothetical protein